MRIGIDLDNTLVCYDELFWRLAVERGWIARTVPARKDEVRDALRRCGREEDWTRLQGEVYGPGMSEAPPFAGALAALRTMQKRRWSTCVVSHRTKTPLAGIDADLHQSARAWLSGRQFLDAEATGLSETSVFLEQTKEGKLARIKALDLTWFIDDLPELLIDAEFPPTVQRMLFDPHRRRPDVPTDVAVVHHWDEVVSILSGARGA